jgi:hypothetical protein
MFDSRWRIPVLLIAPVAVAATVGGVTGCGSHNQSSGGSSTQSAGMAAQTGQFTAAKLRTALLTKVNGMAAATPAESGSYASLPDVKATKHSAKGVSVEPKACAQATLIDFNSAAMAGTPAAAVTFRVGRNGVSEVLAAPAASAAVAALGKRIPVECQHYQATIHGKTYRYTVKESSVKGIGEQARVLNVQTAGYPADNVWSVVYRGTGLVGTVTVVGPNASELAVRELGQQAYEYAAKKLS